MVIERMLALGGLTVAFLVLGLVLAAYCIWFLIFRLGK